MPSPIVLTRPQILAFRRRTNALDERLPFGEESLRRAAWAGLQDSMPRAALLSLHARVEAIEPTSWEHPSLVGLWGPRYNTYVVAKEDFAAFSLGRLPGSRAGRERAERIAAQVGDALGGGRRTDREVAGELGIGNAIRYAATTGTVAIRWAGARAPLVWEVDRPPVEPEDARRELARRYLRVFGPATAERFARWAGVGRREAAATFASLEPELLAVRTPLGDEHLLAADEPLLREPEAPPAPARLLPSGDAYWLLDGAERELLVPTAEHRERLWTPRVWPGALLVEGEIRGTWRRAEHTVRVETWERFGAGMRDAVEAEAQSLPLPGIDRTIGIVWER